MIIKRIIIGNEQKAFIENRFSDSLNIISSDDNNKGKTLVIQSMMYALGNEPIFPSSFDYQYYYYIIIFSLDNEKEISICRKGDSFVILNAGSLLVFDNLSEFKYYLSQEIFTLPKILKDGFIKLVDPVLFYQMFFVGQDKKDTSNIFMKGYYNKNDFINMLYSYYGIKSFDDSYDISETKKEINKLKFEKAEIEKKNKILSTSFGAAGILSMSNDLKKFDEKLQKVERVKNIIIKLNSKRNNTTSRKIKNEITLKELRSLNNTMSSGELRCLDCNSHNIGYSTADKSYTFDVSSIDIRNQILMSIENKINAYDEEIQLLNLEINEHQKELVKLLSVEDVSLEALLIHKDDLLSASDADEKLHEIYIKIKGLSKTLELNDESLQGYKKQQEDLMSELHRNMNDFYKKLDPKGNIQFNELFTKPHLVYSGSEGTEFYLSKLYALGVTFNHNFPIIMDAFRDGELSSDKENTTIKEFSKLGNQIIFTATLKDEELGKYNEVEIINHINYSSNTSCKLLSSIHVEDFKKELENFSLQI